MDSELLNQLSIAELERLREAIDKTIEEQHLFVQQTDWIGVYRFGQSVGAELSRRKMQHPDDGTM